MAEAKERYAIVAKEVQEANIPKADDSNLSIDEIGDGNLNNVYRYTDSTGNTVVLKHAPPYIKCIGPECGLSQHRILIEYRSLCKFYDICQGSVPRPIHYSSDQNSVLMEYLDGSEVMKKQLIAGKVDKVACKQLARNIAIIHRSTHKDNLTSDTFSNLKQEFKNDSLCDLTQKYIFTAPFVKGEPTNQVKPKLLEHADKHVFNNQDLLAVVESFKTKFFNEECLVHGDLHTGSVMVKSGVAKIIDNEFSYVGPMAFDVGLLLAHYIITYHQHMLTENDNDAHRRISYKMLDIIKDTAEVYLEDLSKHLPTYSDQFAASFMSDVAGFAGCELIRRVLGIAHVEDINDNEDMELEVLCSGIRLLQSHGHIDDVGRFLMIGLMLC